MIREIKGYSLIRGYRDEPPRDENALAEILGKISKRFYESEKEISAQTFYPGSIAVIGASSDPNKVGYAVFREIGEEGGILEDKVLQIAEKYGIRMVGPNCLGIILPHKKINATFDPVSPKPGHLAFISQSGAIITTVVDWSLQEDRYARVFDLMIHHQDIWDIA